MKSLFDSNSKQKSKENFEQKKIEILKKLDSLQINKNLIKIIEEVFKFSQEDIKIKPADMLKLGN